MALSTTTTSEAVISSTNSISTTATPRSVSRQPAPAGSARARRLGARRATVPRDAPGDAGTAAAGPDGTATVDTVTADVRPRVAARPTGAVGTEEPAVSQDPEFGTASVGAGAPPGRPLGAAG